jgi:hypothetical protein
MGGDRNVFGSRDVIQIGLDKLIEEKMAVIGILVSKLPAPVATKQKDEE